MRRTIIDLQDSGVLWAVNRVLFHPRGFALCVEVDTGKLGILGGGTEPWSYGPSVAEKDHFADFEATLAKAAQHWKETAR